MSPPESTGSAARGRRKGLPTDDGRGTDLPIAQRLARMIREIQEPRGRRPRREGTGATVPRFRTDASEAPLVRLLPPERSLSAVARSREPWEEAPPSPTGDGAARRSGSPPRTVASSDGRRRSRRTSAERKGSGGARTAREPPSTPARSRTDRPEIPQGSRLTAAEIQGLIRAGRGVRTVSDMAEAPIDWVRYLAEPVIAERAAVVSQVLQARPERPRAKGPGEPLGRALLLALRARKVAAPEHVLATGFSAYRRGHGPWRVRLTFSQDGRRLSALWAFDPRTQAIEPRNKLADEIGWRRVSRGR